MKTSGLDKKSMSRNFSRPDERREFRAHGHLDLLEFSEGVAVGRAIFEPGWKWSADIKPIAETESCEAEHVGYCMSGKMIIRMNSGEEIRIQAGDVFYLEPGHDAWVEGNESCEILDFDGFKNYAKSKKAEKAA